jgi:oligopeptidase B
MNPIPPIAKRVPVTHTIHGDTRVDHYAWLQKKEDPEVIAYLEAENAYTKAVLAPTEALQKALYDEMLGRIQETDLSVPYPQDGFRYYQRTEEGKQYPIYCRVPQGGGGEQITLDVNVLAQGEKFMAIGAYAVSDDGSWLAYSTDVTGFREYTLFIKDLRTGELLPDRIEKAGTVVWAGDNRTLFTTREDAAKRTYRILRHTIGGSDDAIVFEEPDALYRVGVYRSRDRQFVFIGSESSITTEIHYLPAQTPDAALQTILPREEGHEYYVDHRDGLFYLRTNLDAVNFRLVAAPVDSPEPGHWSEVIPHRPEVMLEDFLLFADHLVVTELVEGLPVLRIVSFATGEPHTITFPEPTYTASAEINREFATTVFRFRYASLITPLSVFDYDLKTRERTLLKETPVLGGYDRSQYVSERRFATASDGVRIPISLVRRRDTPVDGSAPGLLYGYGSYGIVVPAGFSSTRLSLLDRGFVYAIAHIRGGGELGKPWHDAGKMMVKQTTFTDFIACADDLVEQRVVDRKRLVIAGGSAGGLLMGAVINLRPDIAAACLSHVPFVDVINTMLDDTLPLTVGEYLEWGNPNEPEAYAVMKAYSPYDNIHPVRYPNLLVKTSLNDSQVMYWEPAKYVARLRAECPEENRILLHTNMDSGHGGASGRYDALRELAMDYAFLIRELT